MKVFTGRVVSTKMNKTVVVEVVYRLRHPLYKKLIKRSRKLLAHNTRDDISVHDTVKIRETRPMSKTKHFIVVDKVKL